MDIVINKNRIKTGVLHFGFFVFLSLMLFNCQGEILSAKQIVQKSVEAHGGIDNWNNIKQFSFDKQTTLFNEDGSVELSTDQFQLFRPEPTLFGKIEWEDSGNDIVITYEDEKINKAINDTVITSADELAKAKSSFFAAQYVVDQPFALLDKGVELTLNGVEVLDAGETYSISVKYDGDTEDSNQWIYYIDTESFEVVANKVVLKDHISWVENLTFDTVTDFKFNAKRKSYRLNDAGEKTYLRAEYYYSNFSVLYQE